MPRKPGDARGWLLLAAAALVPRALGAALRPPWHDEYFTAWVAGLPWRGMLAALRLDSGPPLPYALAKVLAAFGVPALAAARGLAVAAGTAAVLLGALAARRAFGPAAGWWTGALLAVHPLALAWSSEGRAYALVLAAAAWGWERIERLAHDGRGAPGLAIAVALGCWSHAFGLVLAGALALAALTVGAAARRRALGAVAAGVASHLPWLPVALAQPAAATAWMAQAWHALAPPERALAPVRLLPPAAPFAAQLDLPSTGTIGQVAAAAICVALLLIAARGPRAWLLLAVPAAGLGGLALLGVPAFYGGRGEALFLVPFLALLASATARLAPARWAAAALVAAGALVSAIALRDWARWPPSGEARLATALARALPGGGSVVVGGYWRLGIGYHLGRGAQRFELISYPAEAARHPGWYDDALDRPAADELERLATELRSREWRCAIVTQPGLATATDLAKLARALGLVPALAVPGATLEVPRGGPR
ncbi:MAG TPA: hypothetical protein VLW17_00015 [Thermoanaerobaculaceae bacterium]|nr:hypothetical protein [Thermoanaerobaculaceae bacterium]